jgi:hypothetical protein
VPVTLFSLSSDMATLGRARSEVEEKLELVAIGFLGPTARHLATSSDANFRALQASTVKELS